VAHANNKKSAASTASVTAAFNETRVEIEEREWKVQSLEKQIADASILNEKSNEKVQTLTASLESLQSALNAEKEQHAAAEKRLHEAIRERDENLQSVRGAHENVKTDLDQHKNDLLRLNRDLEAATLLRSTLQGDITAASSKIKELEHELKSTVQVKDQNNEQVRSLSEELGKIKSELNEARAALDSEKEQRATAEAQLNAAIRVRDDNLQSVRGAHDQTKSDLDVHRNDLMRLNRDLEAATHLTSVLLADFNAASVRIDQLEHDLNSVVQGKEQTGQQARSLSDDLERTKAELETERRIRRTAEVNLQKSSQVSSKLEGDIARSAAEKEALKAALERERLLHTETADKARAAAHAKEHVELKFKTVKEDHERHVDLHAATIEKLNQDFEQALARQRDLEQKVKTLESDKAAAEARAEALANEIDQARTALADEWEDHMNDEERLAATEKRANQMAQSLSGNEKAASERERKWAVVVKQTDLPAEIRPTPKAVITTNLPKTQAEIIPDKNQEGSISPGIEDLFEDDTPQAPVGQIPVPVHPHAAPASETPVVINEEEPDEEFETTDEPEADQDADEREATEKGDEQAAGEDDDDEEEPEDEEDNAGDQIKTLDDFGPPSGYGISFNLQQWFDLIKWSHHSGALSQQQRMQIVRMRRLIQKGRKLTQKQDEQVREMMVLVQTLGYRFH
jgi:chromosome segregation ATPase